MLPTVRFAVLTIMLAVYASSCTRPAGSFQSQAGDSTWRLAELDGRAALPDDAARRPWIRFAPDSGRVSGHLGCNRGTGTFTVDGSSLKFGPIATTRMACAEDALNRQETALGAALQATEAFEMRGDTLVLLAGSRPVARFVR